MKKRGGCKIFIVSDRNLPMRKQIDELPGKPNGLTGSMEYEIVRLQYYSTAKGGPTTCISLSAKIFSISL